MIALPDMVTFRKYSGLLLISLVLQLFLAFFLPGHYYDISNHRNWTDTGQVYGFKNIYVQEYRENINFLHCDYPVVSPFVWHILGKVYYGLDLDQKLQQPTFAYYNHQLDSGERNYYWADTPQNRAQYKKAMRDHAVGKITLRDANKFKPNPLRTWQYISVGDQVYSFLLRLWPIFGGFLLMGLLFYYFGENIQRSKWLPWFIIFNPLIYVNCAIWGQTDIVGIALLLWAFLLLLYSKRPFWSIVVLVIALNTKLQNALFVPFYGVAFLWAMLKAQYWPLRSWKEQLLFLMAALGAFVGVWFLLYLPFYANGTFWFVWKTIMWDQITAGGQQISTLSVDTWNVWWLFEKNVFFQTPADYSSNVYWGFICPAVIGPIISKVSMVIVFAFSSIWLWLGKHKQDAPFFLFFSMGLFELLVTAFMPGMVSRFMLWSVFFLFICVILEQKNKLLLFSVLAVMGILFLELLQVVRQPFNLIFNFLTQTGIYPAYTYPLAIVFNVCVVLLVGIYIQMFFLSRKKS